MFFDLRKILFADDDWFNEFDFQIFVEAASSTRVYLYVIYIDFLVEAFGYFANSDASDKIRVLIVPLFADTEWLR